MKKALVSAATILWAMSSVLLPMAVSAQSGAVQSLPGAGDLGINRATGTGLGQQDPRTTITNIIRIGLSFLGIVALVIVLYGGVLWMTAAGNDDKVGQAKKVLFSGVIGIIIIFSAYALSTFVLDQLFKATGGSGSAR